MAITDTAPRVQYTVGGSAQTAFTVNFKFFAEGDLVVYNGTTALSYAASPSDATEYSVSGAGEASGGTVTLGGSGVTNTTITIIRDVPVARSTDFPASGPFQIDSLNDELDKFAAMIAEREDQTTRTLSAPDTDPTGIDMTLPAKANRLGKYLQFNATTGLPEAGPNSADVTTLADIATDIATLADIEDGTDATDAIQTVAGISGNVATVAGISSDVTTVAGDTANIATVATDLTGSDTIGTVAGIAANVTSVAGIASDVTAVAADATDIGTVATDLSGSDTIGTVAGIAANVSTVAGISSDVTTVAADGTDIGTVAGISSNVTTVAGISGNVTTVAGISADVTTVAADGTDIGTVAGISGDVTSVAGVSANVTTVAGISSNVTTVAGISSDVTSVAGVASDVTTVAGISSDVSSVAAQVVGYAFSTTTTMADPGSGNVRFNNATVASVTAIAIDDLDSNGVDQSPYIVLWDDSTNTVKGTLVFRTSGGDVATFNITGLTDNTGWFELAVTHVASSGTFSNAEDAYIGFTRAGDKGADGAGSGDVSGPGSSTDNAIVRWDSTSGQLVQDSGVTISDAGAITATAGGSLTGTWSDLGSVTTVDINGGTIDGSTIGAAVAAAGNFTNIDFTGNLTQNGSPFTSGGGYFKGENGTVGSNAGDIFRVNEQELNTDVTISSTENASAAGPLSVASGTTLTVDGNLTII